MRKTLSCQVEDIGQLNHIIIYDSFIYYLFDIIIFITVTIFIIIIILFYCSFSLGFIIMILLHLFMFFTNFIVIYNY